MNKAIVTGVAISVGLIGYKVGVYATALYKLQKQKRQKVINLGTYSEYKEKLKKEEELLK